MPPPASLPSARDLGLPRAARDLFDRLAREPPGDWAQLEARIFAHARSFEVSDRSEFLPVRDARALGERLPQLTKFAQAQTDPTHQQLIWVAGRYFEISTDGTHDYTIGGLDDDVALFNAVAQWVGAAHLCITQD
jgi:hypothetical protein